MKTLGFLLPYLRPRGWQYAAGVLFIPLSTFSALSVPRLLGEAVTHLESQPKQLDPLLGIGAWILVYAALRGLGLFGSRMLIVGASRQLEFDLRNRLYSHLLSLDRAFYNSARTGDLMNRTTLDVEAARLISGPVLMYSINCLCMLGLALPLMIAVDLHLTLLALIPLCLLTAAVRFIGPRVHSRTREAQEALSQISSFGQQNFGGMRVVKAYSMQDRETGAFRRLCDRYFERSLSVENMSNCMGPIVSAVSEIAAVLLLVVGGTMILTGDFSLGEFIKFSGYQAMLIWPMISIGWVVNQVYRGVASVDRLQQIFSRESTVSTPATPVSRGVGKLPTRFRGDVEIHGLTFSLGTRVVLKNINMRVPAGQTVAILGRTGTGKSTLLSLIPRLYPAPDGSIFLDGIDVNRIPLSILRRQIGFVSQETFLFSRTIAENIAVGLPEEVDRSAFDERITRFAAVSRLNSDLDQFTRGYDETVGERGVTLSGGQRQRVAISRALIGEPPVIIFDNALSAVDTQTEEEILRNLRSETREVTVLVVSHRISSVKAADHIYVLDDGAVVEEGSHEELLGLGGEYASLYRQQILADELEEME